MSEPETKDVTDKEKESSKEEEKEEDTVQTPKSPAASQKGSAKSGGKPATPAKAASKPGTPVKAASKPGTPVKAASKPGTPVKAASKPGTPVKAASKPGTPVKAASKPGTPVKTDSKASTPAKVASPKGKPTASPPKSPKTGRGSAADKGRATPKGKGKAKEDDKKSETPAPTEDGEEEGLPEGCVPLFLSSKTQEIFHCRCDEDVTNDNPIKIITKAEIMEDFKMRAAVCDFHPVKQQIIDFPSDEILIVYDYDFKFGENFYVALTEESKEKILNPPSEAGEEGEGEPEEEVVYKYIPPEPKDWVSHGSEKEIKEESVSETRRRIKVSVKRIRKDFGAPCEFKDRNVADAKDGYIECLPFADPTFDLKKEELNKGIQAIPRFQEAGTQTDWKYPRNAKTQYYPREFNEQEKEEIVTSKNLCNFVEGVAPRFKLALQQNEIMDVFFNDWLHLGDPDAFGSKADNHLKEYQSFTDLQFSKEKKVTCIQWHPTIKGVVAVAVAEKLTFDERIDNAAKVIMTPSLILIWSFTDPIHPQLLLEAPDDIYSFQFSQTDPNIIAGGCYNGQVVLWDISAHADRLKQPRGGNRNKKTNALPGFEDENALKTPVVRYCAVSCIEQSHKAAITDILWLPDHMEVNRMGVPQENKSLQCCQIMTCATDHCVMVWDTRPTKPPHQTSTHHKDTDKGPKNPMGVPNTFQHLDLSWKPSLKVTLHKAEPGGDHSPTKFSIQERQGDRSALGKATEGFDLNKETASTGGNYFTGIKPGSGKDKRTLQSVKTHFFVGTEDGEIVYVDWMPQKDADTGKIQTPKPDFYHSMHDGPVVALQRSPFFKDVLLCVGGWTFTIWKEGVSSGPILHSAANPVRYTAAYWSPARPAVFYIAKMDGSVDVWDLLDKTHEPSVTQSVSPVPITTIYPFQVTQKQHLLAVGDNSGTLHILEIPWSQRNPTPNEHTGMANYFEREVKRRAFVVARWDFREAEKREIEAEIKRKAGIAPNVVLTDEEVEFRLKTEYQQYVEEEQNFLRGLGLLKEDEEPLPEV